MGQPRHLQPKEQLNSSTSSQGMNLQAHLDKITAIVGIQDETAEIESHAQERLARLEPDQFAVLCDDLIAALKRRRPRHHGTEMNDQMVTSRSEGALELVERFDDLVGDTVKELTKRLKHLPTLSTAPIPESGGREELFSQRDNPQTLVTNRRPVRESMELT
jgi:hypothetical protein